MKGLRTIGLGYTKLGRLHLWTVLLLGAFLGLATVMQLLVDDCDMYEGSEEHRRYCIGQWRASHLLNTIGMVVFLPLLALLASTWVALSLKPVSRRRYATKYETRRSAYLAVAAARHVGAERARAVFGRLDQMAAFARPEQQLWLAKMTVSLWGILLLGLATFAILIVHTLVPLDDFLSSECEGVPRCTPLAERFATAQWILALMATVAVLIAGVVLTVWGIGGVKSARRDLEAFDAETLQMEREAILDERPDRL